eukprot:2955700-Pleurochrysis_carterae.AAC.1
MSRAGQKAQAQGEPRDSARQRGLRAVFEVCACQSTTGRRSRAQRMAQLRSWIVGRFCACLRDRAENRRSLALGRDARRQGER